MFDLRSDTVTKPSKEILESVLDAELGDDEYMEGISEPCEAIIRGKETLEDQDELFQRLEEEFDLIDNRREYVEECMLEEDEEQARVDEKRGVYAEHEDVAN